MVTLYTHHKSLLVSVLLLSAVLLLSCSEKGKDFKVSKVCEDNKILLVYEEGGKRTTSVLVDCGTMATCEEVTTMAAEAPADGDEDTATETEEETAGEPPATTGPVCVPKPVDGDADDDTIEGDQESMLDGDEVEDDTIDGDVVDGDVVDGDTVDGDVVDGESETEAEGEEVA